jgi:iron only hydrogenase large subunit-like protein
MIEKIIKEKISADHLLYVSLKYTKTCDVILNLIKRWTIMIDDSIQGILEHLKKKKKLKIIPLAPRQKTEIVKKMIKDEEVKKAIELYEFFKRIDHSRVIRENEFRKNVHLKIQDNGKEVIIDLEKLKEYTETLEKFITYIKQLLLAK